MHGVEPLAPSLYDILSFVLHLSTRLKAPGSVSNYLSSVKTWFTASTGSTGHFDSHHVKILKKGITNTLNHQVLRAFHLMPSQLFKIVQFIKDLGVDALVYAVSLIFGYLTLVRQSNLVSLALDKIGPHTLLASQVTVTTNAITVSFPTVKTRSSSHLPLSFSLLVIPHSPCCPVSTWLANVSARPLPLNGPALVLPDGSYLTASVLSHVVNLAASAVLPTAQRLTLHSLRKAQVPIPDIQEARS